MDLLTVDPVLLRTFRVVVSRKSMARAADELGFVPSAVSQHVSRLEKLVGTQLLVRTPGEPLAPTAAGRVVDGAAAVLLGRMADFVSACRAACGDLVELRVAMYASAACELLPKATYDFMIEHPGARVHVLEAEPAEGLSALTTGAVDLVIAYRYRSGEVVGSADAQETVLGVERLPLVRSATGPAAGGAWIAGIPGSPSRRLLEEWASVNDVPLSIRYESEYPHTVLALCAAGLGQGIVPASVIAARKDLPVEDRDLTIEGRPLRRQVLAMIRRGYTHPLTEAFCEKMSSALAELS